jgi:hypothetical protein
MERKSFKRCIIVFCAGPAKFSMLATLCPAEETLRVGIFDSRAIAHAYYLSGIGKQIMSSWVEKLNQAKKEGDDKLIKELQAWGQAIQLATHLQGFSIACVVDMFEKIEAELPKIAKEAGVDIIVSKREIVYKNPSIEIVDVTSDLAKLFNPDESALRIIEDLRTNTPVPLIEVLIAEKQGRLE